jgi:membrane fusion protein (multidrug efflux system)
MKRILVLSAALILISSCNKDNENKIKEEKAIPSVKVTEAIIKEYKPVIELSGTAFADREANLGAALPGRVEKIYYPEGSSVKKGDLLVSLSGELYAQAQAELNTVTKDYERVSRLSEKGSIAQQDYDHIKAVYESALSHAALMKKNAEITAPFSGTIVEYLVNEGENYFFNINLEPGYSRTSGILRLMKLDPVQVETEVNEKDLARICKGQDAEVTFDAFPGTAFKGKISEIGQVLSTLTHTSKVKIAISNKDGRIKPGMFAHVKLECAAVSAVSVPMNCLSTQNGTADYYVFTVENNIASRHKVSRLWDNQGWTGIDGIAKGSKVVSAGRDKLSEGMSVFIK